MMHARFPVRRSPERALRALPADVPSWKVSFHRSHVWGFLVPVALVLALVGIVVTR